MGHVPQTLLCALVKVSQQAGSGSVLPQPLPPPIPRAGGVLRPADGKGPSPGGPPVPWDNSKVEAAQVPLG